MLIYQKEFYKHIYISVFQTLTNDKCNCYIKHCYITSLEISLPIFTFYSCIRIPLYFSQSPNKFCVFQLFLLR